MGRARNPSEALRRPRRIYLSTRELELLGPHVGPYGFSEWARAVILGVLRSELPAAIEAVEAPPPRPAKEALRLPPWGEADADRCWYEWAPNRKGDAGTLTIHAPRGIKEVDLVGVEIEAGDGVTLRFSDRSLVREIRGQEES
jgi:hypothetical protein